MDTTPLCLFVSKVMRSNRIVFGDLRRLRRDVLPAGATSREEIETLLSLDGLGQLDDDWPGYLVSTVKDFVLASSDPPGSVDADTASWLATALQEARPKSATVIVRAIVKEARHVDDALLASGRGGAQRPSQPAHGEERSASSGSPRPAPTGC